MRPKPLSVSGSRLPKLNGKRPEPKTCYTNVVKQLKEVLNEHGQPEIDNFIAENALHVNQHTKQKSTGNMENKYKS
ncbi:hypothetical protein QR680_013319 [Steinernema hermaphroditum]|uniref:Uncharacterized protein n=1 Tax=Steinernema hermaphroditum TaxID=289476 RepID=A0AA39I7F2_9BILA|nr:hypothetical protein QR680_013319 [Steinernema hermaphroditum]